RRREISAVSRMFNRSRFFVQRPSASQQGRRWNGSRSISARPERWGLDVSAISYGLRNPLVVSPTEERVWQTHGLRGSLLDNSGSKIVVLEEHRAADTLR